MKIASFIILFLAIVGFLLWQAMGTGTSVVLLPSEITLTKQNLKRIRVAGKVLGENIKYQVEPEFKLTFAIHDPGKIQGKTLNVEYKGIKPDMFAGGRDVIIDGEIQNGQLIAHQLLTQCPSKYEPPTPEKE